MKVIIACCLITAFSLFSFTSDLQSLLTWDYIGFIFRSDPDFSDLLMTADIDWQSTFYVVSKTGHALYFFFFTLIMTFLYRMRTALLWALFLAVSSEFLQLYTNRSGRIVDMLYDLSGTLAAILVLFIMKKSAEIVEGNRRSVPK
ncbi:VanZ family protein [Metabacillus sp. SLBN-84]